MSTLAELARRLARDAARRAPRALATVHEWRHARSQLEGTGEVERSASKGGILLTLRVEGRRGVGSAEESIGPAEVAEPRNALVRAALAFARAARDGGSLRGALEGRGAVASSEEEDRNHRRHRRHRSGSKGRSSVPSVSSVVPSSSSEGATPTARQIFAALRGAARGVRGLSADITIERERTFVATAGEDGERLHARARTGVVLQGELDGCELGLSCELEGDAASLLDLVRATARDARSRARSRSQPAALGKPRLLLVSPSVVSWILHGALVSGFASACPGEPAGVPRWLEVDDGGATTPDEQGIVPSPVALVRDGVFQRGPFLPFDGSGRTRKDGRTAVTRAGLATLVLRSSPARTRRLAALARDAQAALGEVASVDPLPGGRVHVIGHASRGARDAGLAALRASPRDLLAKTVAFSRELEPVVIHDLGVLAPWALLEGLPLRPLRSDR